MREGGLRGAKARQTSDRCVCRPAAALLQAEQNRQCTAGRRGMRASGTAFGISVCAICQRSPSSPQQTRHTQVPEQRPAMHHRAMRAMLALYRTTSHPYT